MTSHFQLRSPAPWTPALLRSPARLALVVLLGLWCAASHSQAASSPPDKMSYQGFLVDGSGKALGDTDGGKNYNVIFRLFAEENSSDSSVKPLWAEQQFVTVDKGDFSVILGDGKPVSDEPNDSLSTVFAGSVDTLDKRYLEISVVPDGAPPFTIKPRLRLLPSPYAFLSSHAVTAGQITSSSGAPAIALTEDQMQFHLFGQQSTSERFSFLDGPGGSPLMTIFGGDGFVWIRKGDLQVDHNISVDGSATVGGGLSAGSATVTGALNAASATVTGALNAASATVTGALNADSLTLANSARVGGTLTAYYINTKSWVGIGTEVPRAPLDVKGIGLNINVTNYVALYNPVGVFTTQQFPSGNPNFSILSEGRIGATELYMYSDARIKEALSKSSGVEDLNVIQALSIKNYRMVDRVADGDGLRKGFIAQEVQQIVPDAVTKSRRFVPDVYAPASKISYDAKAKQVELTLDKTHRLAVGDRVQVFTEASRIELTVAQVPEANRLVLDGCETKPNQVFVYGKEVSDFLSVDYPRLFTTGISALQELHRIVLSQGRRITDLEAKVSEIESLQSEVAALRRQVTAQAAERASFESRFKALEGLVTASSRKSGAAQLDRDLAANAP